MKVKYKIFDSDGYNSCCSMIKDLYPNDPLPTPDEYTKTGIGEVIQFIKGGFLSYDKFIIADDKTGEIIKVKMSDCKKIN